MSISPQELANLNGYCASALFSARLLAGMLRRTHDVLLRLELARRADDACRQAKLWADTIRAVGASPQLTCDAWQRRYEPLAGRPGTPLEALTMTLTFERRLCRRMLRHFHAPQTHPIVRATLRRMIEEELNPGWARRMLPLATRLGEDAIRETERRYAAADARLPDLFEAPGVELDRAA